MPKIYDNSTEKLLDALRGILEESQVHILRIATGYFQFSAWHKLVEELRLPDNFRCFLLIGMLHRTEEGREILDTLANGNSSTKHDLEAQKKKVLEVLQRQLAEGLPTLEMERALKRLQEALQKQPNILQVKAYLCPQALHAKLYLIERKDTATPKIGYLGSSNFTLAGLQTQGELNVDVTDQDATNKLQQWFDHYWNEPCAVDITEELARAIQESWAFQTEIHP